MLPPLHVTTTLSPSCSVPSGKSSVTFWPSRMVLCTFTLAPLTLTLKLVGSAPLKLSMRLLLDALAALCVSVVLAAEEAGADAVGLEAVGETGAWVT